MPFPYTVLLDDTFNLWRTETNNLTNFVDANLKKNNLAATVAPVATDDQNAGYAIGSKWINISTDRTYQLVDATPSAAVWRETIDSSGGQSIAGTTTLVDLIIQNTVPKIVFNDTDAALNEKDWRLFGNNSGNFQLSTYTDGGAFGANAFIINRTGTVVDSFDVLTALNVTGPFTSLGIDDNATANRLTISNTALQLGVAGSLYTLHHTNNANSMAFSGGNGATSGGNFVGYGGTHTSLANDFALRAGATNILAWDNSSGLMAITGTVNISGNVSSLGIKDNATGERINLGDGVVQVGSGVAADIFTIGKRTLTDGQLFVSSGTGTGGGANLRLFGGTHLSQANDFALRADTTNILAWDNSTGLMSISGTVAISGNFSSLGIGDSTTGERLSVTNNNMILGAASFGYNIRHVNNGQYLHFSGGNAVDSGANILAYGGLHATTGDLVFRNDANEFFRWDESAGSLSISSGVGVKTLALSINSTQDATFKGHISIPATESLFLDGGSDTYIREQSANVMQFVTGGVGAMSLTAGQNASFAGNIFLQDSKDIFLGTGQDIAIGHDGLNGHIYNQTGTLLISDLVASGSVILQAYNSASSIRNCVSAGGADGNVTLFYDNQAKLSTTNLGVDILGELTLTAGYSEDADITPAGGAITLSIQLATYWYTPTLTSIPTFTFSGAAASGRLTSFTLELNNAAGFNPVFPASVDWSGGIVPAWTSGKDIVTFITRDGGVTWLGFAGGLDMK